MAGGGRAYLTYGVSSATAHGGTAKLNISGGTVYAGSIGGGAPLQDTSMEKYGFGVGAAIVDISGGTIHGQIVMQGTINEAGDDYGKQSTFTMSGGTIDNTSPNDGNNYLFVEENGGAVYINSGEANVSGGTIQNCSSTNGGAIYVNGGDFELSGNGTIKNCSATDGGSVYVSGGNATINGGTITNSNATNGGAISVSGGNVTINDGTITTSEATTGGAVYISGGNMTITGGTITNSKATNGGGVYISNGNITMDGGTISNNQASQFGGGIYAYSDTTDLTLTITSGSIIGNIASKNGGGVGVNMGTGLEGIVTVGLETCKGLDESHSHPIIKDNTANEYGGGFWLNGDSMTMNMYCGSIDENIAILEAGSSNMYQTGGNATVHAGYVGEGVIVVGGEYVYVPDNQLPELKIIYDSNNPDNPEQTTAYVTEGVEIYLPKNIFEREGFVLYGWAYNPTPVSDDEVFVSGTPYKVDEEVTVYAVWKKEGSGYISTPVIKSGKHYSEITGGTNIMISQDAAFTVQMSVLGMQPNYYTNRTLIFDKNLVNGTNITMVDWSNSSEIVYYYYKVENDSTTNIALTEFTKNGGSESFIDSTSSDTVDETILFIIELPKNNETTGAMQVTLKREAADSEIAPIEQSVTYTTTAKRTFNISCNENISTQDSIKISYQNENPVGDDTRYNNGKAVFVVKEINGLRIPEETKLFDGTNYYTQNGDGEYIIPIGSIDENKELNLQLISKTLSENEIKANLKLELWVSNNENNPYMGDVVDQIDNIVLNAIELTAIKGNMTQKAYTSEEFTGSLELEYETLNFLDYNISLEIQKKISNDVYETQNGVLTSVNSNTTNTNGVFEVELSEFGNINLEFVENLKNQYGTYRILMKVLDNSNVIFELPYNFMILE